MYALAVRSPSALRHHFGLPLAATVASLLLTSCFGALGLPQGGDGKAGRCEQGFDLFEQSRCQPGQAANLRVEAVRFELDQMRRECADSASVQRAARIEQSCLPAYRQAQASITDQRRQVRARYVNEVSTLLLDPDYPPAADRYKDIEEQAARSEAPSLQADLAAAREVLVALARKHGIDPAYAKELDLW